MKHRRAPRKGVLLGALCLLLCLGSLYSLAADRLALHHADPARAAEIEENVAALAQAEGAPLPELNPIPAPPESNPADASDADPEQPPEPLSLADEQTRILAMDRKSVTKSQMLQRFSHAAILGDSIVEAVRAYEYLDDAHVFGAIGVSLVTADKLFDAAILAKPETVFLGFGLNDVNRYGSRVGLFTEQYRSRIEELRAALPDAEVYVLAILPVEDRVDQTEYQYIPDYNAALESLCAELGVSYLDAGFLLTEMPELYDADGIHPLGYFYPYWLTYLADLAGL